MLDKFQKLLPKTCNIKFGTSNNTNLSNKIFKIPQVSTSMVEFERMKDLDSNYSNEAVKITILITILELVQDTTASINIPMKGFKENNVVINFKGKNYVVKEEVDNPFYSSISLYCDTKR